MLVSCTSLIILQLDRSTVWLKEEGGSRAFFPDGSGERFVFNEDVPLLISTLVVEGSVPGTAAASPTVSSFGTLPATRPFQSATSTRRMSSVSVKIVQARILPKRDASQWQAEISIRESVFR